MEKQLLIAIGREFGSGGHEIAEKLSQRLGIKLYDRNLVEEMSLAKGYDGRAMEKYDEKPVNLLFSKNINGYSNSIEKQVAENQFAYLKGLAEKGESFVIVGRCAETVLKAYPQMISIFILGDEAVKQQRVKEIYKLSASEALTKMKRHDKKRKAYHNYYCDGKWGDSRTYDLTINSSRLGIDETVEILVNYIQKRMQ